jgi:four helix bundle protein
MRDFKQLVAWQKSRELVRSVYQLTDKFPPSERFGISVQANRAAVSVAANLAEGCGRRGAREFARFVDIALGSVYELESHLYLALDLGFIDDIDASKCFELAAVVKRLSVRLTERLNEAARGAQDSTPQTDSAMASS